MKRLNSFLPVIIFALVFASCGTGNEATSEANKRAMPGTIVARMEEPVTEDTLNTFTYSIKVIADSNIAAGVYEVEAEYGPNYALGKFSMPKGIEHVVPIIRKGPNRYSYIVGFRLPDDTTFYDYYEVTSNKSNTRMAYIKSYTFE